MLPEHEHNITKGHDGQHLRAMDASHSAQLDGLLKSDIEPVFHNSRICERHSLQVVSIPNCQSFQHSRDDYTESFALRGRGCLRLRPAQTGGGGRSDYPHRRPQPDYVTHVHSFLAFNNGEWGHECPTQKWGEKCNP